MNELRASNDKLREAVQDCPLAWCRGTEDCLHPGSCVSGLRDPDEVLEEAITLVRQRAAMWEGQSAERQHEAWCIEEELRAMKRNRE